MTTIDSYPPLIKWNLYSHLKIHNYKLQWIQKLTLNNSKSKRNSGNSSVGKPQLVRNYFPSTTKAKRRKLSTQRLNPKQNKKSKLRKKNLSPIKSVHRKQSSVIQSNPRNRVLPSTLSISSPRGKMKMPSEWKSNSISKKWLRKSPPTEVSIERL